MGGAEGEGTAPLAPDTDGGKDGPSADARSSTRSTDPTDPASAETPSEPTSAPEGEGKGKRDSAEEGTPKPKERASPPERRPQGDEWVQPQRIAVILAFGISLALFLGTGAALLRIPNVLPVSGTVAILAGLLEVPALLFFVAGLERRASRFAPLLLLSCAGGLTSYFVGGAVGIGSSTTLGAGVIALVVFLMVGRPTHEKRKRRIQRVRRWSRNAAVLGILLLLLGFGLYEAWSNTAPAPFVQGTLSSTGTVLTPGGNYSFPITGGAGDQLYLLLGASNAAAHVQGALFSPGGVPLANVSAGTLTQANVTLLSLRSGGGTFTVWIDYPSVSSGPSSVTVKWSVGDIQAGIVAMLSAAAPSAWAGFILVVVGGTLWVVTRPPSPTLPPSPSTSTTPEGETPPETGSTSVPADGSPTTDPLASSREEGSSASGTTLPTDAGQASEPATPSPEEKAAEKTP